MTRRALLAVAWVFVGGLLLLASPRPLPSDFRLSPGPDTRLARPMDWEGTIDQGQAFFKRFHGMTESEVLRKLGHPKQVIREKAGVESWVYHDQDGDPTAQLDFRSGIVVDSRVFCYQTFAPPAGGAPIYFPNQSNESALLPAGTER